VRRLAPPEEVGVATDWDRIVREHGPMVYGTAWRILGHAADAEDVVQDVFLQVHQLQQTHPVRYWVALLRSAAIVPNTGTRNGPGSAAHRFARATRCAASGERDFSS